MILILLCIWLVFYSLLSSLMHGTMNLKFSFSSYFRAQQYFDTDTSSVEDENNRRPGTAKQSLHVVTKPKNGNKYVKVFYIINHSQWPRGLRRRCTAARLLRLGSNAPGSMDVCLL
jgi:hypothetical protein